MRIHYFREKIVADIKIKKADKILKSKDQLTQDQMVTVLDILQNVKDRKKAMEQYLSSTKRAKFFRFFNKKFGEGPKARIEAAIKRIGDHLLSINTGNPDALYKLALYYDNDEVSKKNPEAAARYYQLAADQGHAAAQYELGECYEQSKGVKRDLNEAARYYRLAADQGHAAAQYNLALRYQKGTGVEKNLNEAARYYQLAAAKGHERARARLQDLQKT